LEEERRQRQAEHEMMQAQLASERAEQEAQEKKVADLIQFVSRMGA
jgi:hypothetical protein